MLRRLVTRVANRGYQATQRREAHVSSHITYEEVTEKEAIARHQERIDRKEKVKRNTLLGVKRGSVELGTGPFGKVTKQVTYESKITTEHTDKGIEVVEKTNGGVAEMEFWSDGNVKKCHYDFTRDRPKSE